MPDDIHNHDFPERINHGRDTHQILVGGPDLSFRPATVFDPVPTGRQILDAVDACVSACNLDP